MGDPHNLSVAHARELLTTPVLDQFHRFAFPGFRSTIIMRQRWIRITV